jgi:hypothetical protein
MQLQRLQNMVLRDWSVLRTCRFAMFLASEA